VSVPHDEDPALAQAAELGQGCESAGLVDATQAVLGWSFAMHVTVRVCMPTPHVVEHTDHAPVVYAEEKIGVALYKQASVSVCTGAFACM
jgi:hypothetical protein